MVALTTALLAATAVVLVALAVLGVRNRTTPGARLFTALEVVSVLWVALTLVGLSTPPGPVRVRLWGGSTALSLLTIVLWFAFILRYTGRERWLTLRRFGAVAAPLVATSVVYVVAPSWPPLVGALRQATIPAGTVVQSGIGPVGAVLAAYIYLVFLAGIVLVIKTVLEGNTRFVGQALALVVGTLVPVVASVGAIVGAPARGYPLTQVGLAPQSLLWGYAVFRQELLGLVPAVARLGERAVFEELDDGLLVVGGDGTVLRANPRAREYLGTDTLAGEPVEAVLAEMGVDSVAALPARFRRGGRTYQAKASAVTGWRGDALGWALVVRDVTGLVRRGQRLQVLNRILRHNVRNDMTVVAGAADVIQREGDADIADLGETVARRAEALTTISEKALDAERVFDQSRAVESVDLASLVEDVVAEHADSHPDATAEVTVAADRVRTDRRLLSLVVEEVVENAFVHTGEAPAVGVTVTREGDGVRVAVTDDGPGIPPAELEPIRAGEETALRHTSSFGLWLVHWGVQSLGGDIEVETSDAGSTVALSVPDLDEGGAGGGRLTTPA
ncbi:MAG: histidine kinase N-terminal 7TM domain-containing protein [Halobacteriaceae archaeon]